MFIDIYRVSKISTFIDASPRAVVSVCCCGEAVLEIKCPYSIANQFPVSVT